MTNNEHGNKSMVFGILGFCLSSVPFAGIWLSINALNLAFLQNNIKETGQSLAGRILGIIGLIFSSIATFILIRILNALLIDAIILSIL